MTDKTTIGALIAERDRLREALKEIREYVDNVRRTPDKDRNHALMIIAVALSNALGAE